MCIRRLLPLLSLPLLAGLSLLALSAEPDSGAAPIKKSADPAGKEDRVRDTVITLKTSYSTVDLHESINNGIDGRSGRYYVAPHFRFLLLQPDKKVIARPAWESEKGMVPVQMSLEMVHPEIRPEVVRMLRDSGRQVTITDVRNLQVDSIRVSLDKQYQAEFPVEDFVLPNPQAGAEKIAVTLAVPAAKAKKFVEQVNQGQVNFLVSYSYNQISLDSRVEMLKASILLDNQQVRDLSQRGAEIMSAKQMAEAAANIKREIESKVIEGIGKIEPQSLPVERLMQLFSIGKMWEKTERQIEEIDQRLLKQFALGINAKDFQPFKYQKKVIETLAKETGVANKKKAYFDLYKGEKQGMKISAGLKIGPFGASGEYSKEFEQKMSMGNISDDEFREHVKTYHGAEYTTQGVLERGVEVYDVQKVRAMGEMRIISVTLKPTMGTGFRNMSLTPNVQSAQWVDRTFVSIEDRLKELRANQLKAASFIVLLGAGNPPPDATWPYVPLGQETLLPLKDQSGKIRRFGKKVVGAVMAAGGNFYAVGDTSIFTYASVEPLKDGISGIGFRLRPRKSGAIHYSVLVLYQD